MLSIKCIWNCFQACSPKTCFELNSWTTVDPVPWSHAYQQLERPNFSKSSSFVLTIPKIFYIAFYQHLFVLSFALLPSISSWITKAQKKSPFLLNSSFLFLSPHLPQCSLLSSSSHSSSQLNLMLPAWFNLSLKLTMKSFITAISLLKKYTLDYMYTLQIP